MYGYIIHEVGQVRITGVILRPGVVEKNWRYAEMRVSKSEEIKIGSENRKCKEEKKKNDAWIDKCGMASKDSLWQIAWHTLSGRSERIKQGKTLMVLPLWVALERSLALES